MIGGIDGGRTGILCLQRLEPFIGIEDALTARGNHRGIRLQLRELPLQVELALFQRADLAINLFDFAVGPVPELHVELNQLGQSPNVFRLESGQPRLGLRQMLA